MAIISRLDFNSSTTRDTGTKGYQWTTKGTAPTIEAVGGYKAMHCNGGSIYCTNIGFPNFGKANKFTIEFWFYRPSGVPTSGTWVSQAIAIKYYYGDSHRPVFNIRIANAGDGYFWVGNDDIKVSITQNEWHHFALCSNGATMQAYYDGKLLKGSMPALNDFLNCNQHFGLGGDYGNYDYKTSLFYGYIAGFNVEDRVKYTTEFGHLAPRDYGDEGQGPVNFDNVFPYNQIHDVTIDGQAMIWYPKTYVRAIDLPGGKYKGKYAWQISGRKLPGFHVHRAFIDNNGKVRDGFYLGKYEASNQNGLPASINGATPWVSINTPDAIAKCKLRNTDVNNEAKRDWHIENCFEYWFVSLLMLIELSNADVYTAIGAGGQGSLQKCGSTNAVWRGLYEHWANAWEIVDGCKMDGNGIVQIWDTAGETYVSTGKKLADSGIARGSGTGYDLSDTFIPAADGKGSSFSATTSDGVWKGSNTVTYLGGCWYHGSSGGAFAFDGDRGASYSDGYIGFRLAKW